MKSLGSSLVTLALLALSCGDGATTGGLPEPPCTGNLADRSSDVLHIHDPAIARQGDEFFIYSSSATGSFYRSPDLRRWTAAGTVFEAIPDWIYEEIPNADHIGSPDIAWYDGRWVLYYQSHIGGTCNAAMGVATNVTLDPDSPDYKWVDHGLVLRSTPLFENLDIICGVDDVWYNAIDPTLFVDPVDGKPWLIFGSTVGGIFLVEIDPQTLMPTQHPRDFVLLAARDVLQEDPIVEAPYIVHRDGWYHLFLSHNHCCKGADTTYKIVVGRSRTLAGPYLDREGVPLVEDGGTIVIDGDGSLIGTGHGDVFSHGGHDYLVHHARDADLDYTPVLNVRRLDWDSEGWPRACTGEGG